ncbi:MAG: lipopolysaccharide heptosyltransferase II [Candidatus Omnitrophota bacterium]
MKNILVVNVNWLGDVIFSTTVFKALRLQFPDARICCMAVPRVVPVLECCPYVDEIIVYDEKGAHRWLWQKLKLIMKLRKYHFDAAFLLHRSWTRAFMVYLAGVRQRVGYDVKDLGRLLTRKVDVPEGNIHRADYYLHVIESFGIPVTDRTIELSAPEDARRQVDSFLMLKGIRKDDFLAVVNPGGNWPLKRWPKENFALLIERMIRELKIRVVISGSAGDEALADEIREASHVVPLVMAGKTSLPQIFALMKRANIVISADSGPMHMASSAGTPTIAIFGPTRPEVTGPRGKGEVIILQKELECNKQACYNLDCPDNRCMRAVTVDEVFDRVLACYQSWSAARKQGS